MTTLLNALDEGDVKAIRCYLEANKNPETLMLVLLAAIGAEASTSTLKALIKFNLDYHKTHPWSFEAIKRQIMALDAQYSKLIRLYSEVWTSLSSEQDLDAFLQT